MLKFVFKGKTAKAGVTALMLCVGMCWSTVGLAQRTMRGESLLSMEAALAAGAQHLPCAEISYGRYLLGSCWKAGITGMQYSKETGGGDPTPYAHIAAFGDWTYRLAATRDRRLDLYAGAGVFLGYEAIDPWKPKETDADAGISTDAGMDAEGPADGSFLYGVRLRMETEVFFCKRAALVLSGTLPVNFTSSFGWIHPCLSAGIRINI